MLPNTPMKNVVDERSADAELAPKSVLRNTASGVDATNSTNVILSQFCGSILTPVRSQITSTPFGLHVLVVIGVCPRKKVGRSYTISDVAYVTDTQPVRNRPDYLLVGVSVCKSFLPVTEEPAITVSVIFTCPKPTVAIGSDFGPKQARTLCFDHGFVFA
jgi:hypothetical protein